jgi:hypothetical protein
MSSSSDYDEYSDFGSDYSYDFDGYDENHMIKDDGPLQVTSNRTEDSLTDFIDSTMDRTPGAQEHRCNEAGESLVSLSPAFLAGISALPLELKEHIFDYTLLFGDAGGNAEQGILVTDPPLIGLTESADHRKHWRGDDCPGLSVSRPDQAFLNVTFETAEREKWTCGWAGHAIFKEIIKAWYRRNTFILSDLRLLADFAITDCWAMEVVPKHHLRRVEFSIHEDDLAQSKDIVGYGRPSPRLTQLRAELDLLRNLCEGTQITMHVSSQTFSERSVPAWKAEQGNSLLEFLEKMEKGIFKKLRGLRADGYQLTVVVDGDCIITPEKQIDHGVWFSLMLDMCGKQTSGVDNVSSV